MVLFKEKLRITDIYIRLKLKCYLRHLYRLKFFKYDQKYYTPWRFDFHFITRMKISLLQLVLDTVSNRCAKKTVVRMTELVAALLTVHGSLSFLADVDHLLDPSGGVVWLFPCRSPTQSHVRLSSWYIYYLLCQEPAEEVIFSFFWWRLPVEVETSRYIIFVVVSKEFSSV